MQSFLEKVESGQALVSDGATGTNLQKRGLPRGVSSEAWLFEKPDEIISLHRDFVRAGADILLTNTFGASTIRLESAELKGRVNEVNQLAVDLAREAIGGAEIFIAGSIGPAGQLLKPYGPLESDAVFDSYAAQAEALNHAGIAFFVIETQFDLKEATLAVQAVKSASSLPIVCSFSYDRGMRTMMGVSPAQMAKEIGSLGVDLMGVNCGRSLEENLAALQELKVETTLPLWFKPNAGKPERDAHGVTQYNLSPQAMGAEVPSWLDAGASIIGGCCGTTPEHMAAIAGQVKNL